MKKRNQEALLGLVIFVSIFILISGIIWLKDYSLAKDKKKYTALFPNVGALQVGDPVTANGVKQGKVTRIFFKDKDVAVEFKIEDNITITDSCDIRVQNIGLMGERRLGIDVSDKGKVIKPGGGEKATYLRGSFDTGIAEALGMAGRVLREVLWMVDSLEKVITQTVGNDEFVKQFNSIVDRVDRTLVTVEGLVDVNSGKINSSVDNLHNLSADAKDILERNSSEIDKIVDDGSEITDRGVVVLNRTDSITMELEHLITDINEGKGAVGKLLKDEEFSEDLTNTLVSLDSLVDDINDNGLRLRVKLFGNRKYFKD